MLFALDTIYHQPAKIERRSSRGYWGGKGNKSYEEINMSMIKIGDYTLLKDGIVVDGTGNKGSRGSVLLNGPLIEKVIYGNTEEKGRVIDCSGLVIAPGFIDCHSHLDWFMAMENGERFMSPFTEQGITSVVGGNCGFSLAALSEKMDSRNEKAVVDNLFKEGLRGINRLPWRSMTEYFQYLSNVGISHNLAMFVGHGSVRASIKGLEPSPLTADEKKLMLSLMEAAMDEGARGVSCGLQYEPGQFAPKDELEDVARLVKKHDKVLAVHLRAYSAVSAAYPVMPFGTPHNLIALKEILGLARRLEVRLQISHMIFVGTKTWSTCDDALEMIDRAIDDGIDVKFDTFAYSHGAPLINSFIPPWFISNTEKNYRSRKALLRLRFELKMLKMLLGIDFEDMQIIRSNNAQLDRFNGMFLGDIARERGMNEIENFVDYSEKSGGRAAMIVCKYSTPEIIKKLMKHRASLFMTDAWVEPGENQNSAAYGCFPRFLQLARDEKLISIEEAVHKMTGAAAERMRIHDRGVLHEKKAADIVVFDPAKIRDNNPRECGNMRPTGIEAVFVNGIQVLKKGISDVSVKGGTILR
ncbi:MAG: N-acyl-D-amino-acid deacylase family protein [Bacillota bacterium]